MPRHCVVPGCKSNYLTTKVFISTFSFPKNAEIRQKWINAIHRADWRPTNCSSVCKLHFRESDFQPMINYKSPRLVNGAIPSVFPDLPQHLTENETIARKDPEIHSEELISSAENKSEQFISSVENKSEQFISTVENKSEQFISSVENKSEQFIQSDIITNFYFFKNNFKVKVNYKDYHTYESNDKLVFILLENSSDLDCKIIVRISIDSNLIIRVILQGTEVPHNELKWILPDSLKLTLWSQLENLLSKYKLNQKLTFENRKYFLERALFYLKTAQSCDEDLSYKLSGKLDILTNQQNSLQES